MESSSCCSSSSLGFVRTKMPLPFTKTSTVTLTTVNYSRNQKRPSSVQASAISYQKFIHFALEETKKHTHLEPSHLQDRYSSVISTDGTQELQMQAFEAPKIRLLRSLSIENETMQVLDFGVFPKPEYDLPIFCANIFSNASTNIILMDLNPLHDVITQRDYKEKYYSTLMHLGVKYAELLPWGGKLTSESMKFFSPIVIWTRFSPSQEKYYALYSAFMDYYNAWLLLVDGAEKETDNSRVLHNREAQHRYLTWRAEKDPGHGVLKKLVGNEAAKDLLKNFLFDGINDLGSKNFLDYFPEYRSEDGTVIERRSFAGKSFETRPWDARGEFLGNGFTT